MSTKTEIINVVNSIITPTVNTNKHKNSMLELINELYPTSYVSDTNLTETYTTKSGNDIEYNLKMIKQGNVCHFSVKFKNTTLTTLSGTNIFVFKNNQYRPSSDTLINFKTDNIATQLDVGISGATGGTLRVYSSIPPDTTFSFSFQTYLTQNS